MREQASKQAWRDVRLAFVAVLVLGSSPACLVSRDDAETGEQELVGSTVEAIDTSMAEGSSEEVVYESVKQLGPSGELITGTNVGHLSLHEAQLVARPWTHLDEPYVYREVAWAQSLPDGRTSQGYRVTRSTHRPIVELATSGPPIVDPALLASAATSPTDELLPVIANLRDYPIWDIPVMPGMALGVDDRAQVAAEREEAIAKRKALFADRSAELIEAITKAGGAITGLGWGSGWLDARVPAGFVPTLAERPDLVALNSGDVSVGLGWHVGEGRVNSRLHAKRFHDAGYTGEHSNNGRHGFGDITLVQFESAAIEDEGCFLSDYSTCDRARLQERVRCDHPAPDYCATTSNFPESAEHDHATAVASIAIADYTQGQGDAYPLGDVNWAPGTGHSTLWKERASGMAREAKLIYMGMLGNTITEAATNALTVAMNRNVDIVFSAWYVTGGGTQCNARAILDVEQEAENAFDDGIFVTFLTGNEPAADGTCDMSSPADIPKVFAVAGYDSASAACESNPRTGCFLEPYSYKNGGGDAVTADGVTRSRVLSMVDAVAPTHVKSMTHSNGDYGEVNDVISAGSSLAVPHVAGLAALVKDQYLALGWDWINNPGRLHGVMLGMTDRHYDSGGATTAQLPNRADRQYGLGKAKLRLLTNAGGLGAWGSWHGTYTFNSAGMTGTHLWNEPMPVGTKILKCVLLQVEDMSPPSGSATSI